MEVKFERYFNDVGWAEMFESDYIEPPKKCNRIIGKDYIFYFFYHEDYLYLLRSKKFANCVEKEQ